MGLKYKKGKIMKKYSLRKISVLAFVGFLGMGIFQNNHFVSVADEQHVNQSIIHVPTPQPSQKDPIWPDGRS